MKQLITAPAPHAHSGDSVRRNMLLVILALLPAYVVSVIEFGIGALITAAISVIACVATEWLISRYLLKENKQTIGDLSAVLTGLLLAFNLPSNIDWWIVVIGAIVAIGIAKMSYGGLGQNPFNPALVGRVFLLIAFPVQMTTWPIPQGFATSYVDAETAATPLYYLKHAVKTGQSVELPSLMDSLLGSMGGSLGAKPVNDAVLGMIINKHKDNDCVFLHATGKNGHADFMEKAASLGLSKCENLRISEYIYDMPYQMAAADVTICRAGAMTISELANGGKCAVFIPSPNVTDNHQYKNAKVLVDAGAAAASSLRSERTLGLETTSSLFIAATVASSILPVTSRPLQSWNALIASAV